MSKNNKEEYVVAAIFISAVIIVSMFVYAFTMPRPETPYFPLWILGSDRMAPGSTMGVTVNSSQLMFIGAQNKMGQVEYCKILVKFRNESQPIPSTANNTSSSLPPLLSSRFFLANNETWETKFEFKILGVNEDNQFAVNKLEINNILYDANLPATWDANRRGFYYQFIFELWLYNGTINDFSFSGVWISSPFLNVIA